MRWQLAFLLAFCPAVALAAAKPHVVFLGRPQAVKLFVGPNEGTALEIRIRPLLVDGVVKEFTTGEAHDVTERTFVVRRAFRINDVLPADPASAPRWKWQRGGWLLVDRTTGRVAQLSLPEFDPFYSTASWYRDYVAYCGLSENGERVDAIVAQLGRRRPVVKKELGAAQGKDVPDSECAPPEWQRAPVRVTFAPAVGPKVTFAVRGQADAPLADTEAP